MATHRDRELADEQLREPCRKALVSLNEHWTGLTLFVDDPRIPMDNNYGERLIRNPAVGRKNYYGSGSEWSGRLAMMLFSLFATLALWKINPRKWLNYYFAACAASGGKAPAKERIFLALELGGRSPSRTTKFDQQRVLPRHFLTHFTATASTRCIVRRLRKTNPCLPWSLDAAPIPPSLR